MPFSYDGSGGFIAIDFDPTSKGVRGQIILTSFEGSYRKIANNFTEFLEKYKTGLENDYFEVLNGRLEIKSGAKIW